MCEIKVASMDYQRAIGCETRTFQDLKFVPEVISKETIRTELGNQVEHWQLRSFFPQSGQPRSFVKTTVRARNGNRKDRILCEHCLCHLPDAPNARHREPRQSGGLWGEYTAWIIPDDYGTLMIVCLDCAAVILTDWDLG